MSSFSYVLLPKTPKPHGKCNIAIDGQSFI